MNNEDFLTNACCPKSEFIPGSLRHVVVFECSVVDFTQCRVVAFVVIIIGQMAFNFLNLLTLVQA